MRIVRILRTLRTVLPSESLPVRILTVSLLALTALVPTGFSQAADHVVYSVFKPLDLGNAGETPQKDYYVNMGASQGLRVGTSLDVLRRVSTYDLLNEKLYQDVTFPVARIRVIHVENNAAICRLDKVLSPEKDKTPESTSRAVMVGDLVRPAQ